MMTEDEYKSDPVAQVIPDKTDEELVSYLSGVFASAGYLVGLTADDCRLIYDALKARALAADHEKPMNAYLMKGDGTNYVVMAASIQEATARDAEILMAEKKKRQYGVISKLPESTWRTLESCTLIGTIR